MISPNKVNLGALSGFLSTAQSAGADCGAPGEKSDDSLKQTAVNCGGSSLPESQPEIDNRSSDSKKKRIKPEGCTPELRFSDFKTEWIETTVKATVTFSQGRGYSKRDLTNKGTPIFLYGRLYTRPELTVTQVDSYSKIKPGSAFSVGGEIIMPASGESAEDIVRATALIEAGVIIAGDTNVLKPIVGFDSVFLALRKCSVLRFYGHAHIRSER